MKKFFAHVKGSESTPKLNPPNLEPIWNPEILYKLKSVEDTNSLEVSWWILPKFYLEQPEWYLYQLLGHGKRYFFLFIDDFCRSFYSNV